MKLDARDKLRLQWGVTILIGGAAVLYACTQLMILPLRHAREAGATRLAKYQDRIERAAIDLQGMDGIRAEVSRLRREVDTATNLFLLRPVLGSMIVPAQNFVEPIAQECGLQIDSCAERSRNAIPVNMKDAVQTIERYLTELTASGPYAAVWDFIAMMEKTNAYVCVTDVEIFGQSGDVSKHKIRICMEWPVAGQHKAPAPVREKAASPTEDDP